MKQLITTYSGGHPLYLQDLAHIQSAFKELFTEFIKNVITSNVPTAVRGVNVIQDGEVFVPAGSIFWNNELFLVDEQLLEGVDIGDCFFEIVITYEPETVVYENGDVRAVHQIRKLRLRGSDPGEGLGFALSALQRLTILSGLSLTKQGGGADKDVVISVAANGTIVAKKLKAGTNIALVNDENGSVRIDNTFVQDNSGVEAINTYLTDTGWQDITFHHGYEGLDVNSLVRKVRKFVSLRGYVDTVLADDITANFATLPAGFAPGYNIYRTVDVFSEDFAQSATCIILITTGTGQLSTVYFPTGVWRWISLGDINYYID